MDGVGSSWELPRVQIATQIAKEKAKQKENVPSPRLLKAGRCWEQAMSADADVIGADGARASNEEAMLERGQGTEGMGPERMS